MDKASYETLIVLCKQIQAKFQRNNVYTFTCTKFLVDKITFIQYNFLKCFYLPNAPQNL